VAGESEAIFTQEQHEQLLASAVENATAEARASADADVLSLNEQLADLAKANEALTEEVETLKQGIADRDELDRLADLADDRVTEVKAVASFNDEQIDKRKESWAKMSEEDFASYLEDIQLATASAKPEGGDAPKSNFDGTRATAGDEGTEGSVVADFFGVTSAKAS
jgi:cell division protein FtsB